MQHGSNPMNAEYGPGNQYLTGPHFPNAPLHGVSWYDNPMPPRDRNLIGAGIGGGLAGATGGWLAGPGGAFPMGALGSVAAMGGEAIADHFVRQPARNAYNNEYPPMANHLAPRF